MGFLCAGWGGGHRAWHGAGLRGRGRRGGRGTLASRGWPGRTTVRPVRRLRHACAPTERRPPGGPPLLGPTPSAGSLAQAWPQLQGVHQTGRGRPALRDPRAQGAILDPINTRRGNELCAHSTSTLQSVFGALWLRPKNKNEAKIVTLWGRLGEGGWGKG